MATSTIKKGGARKASSVYDAYIGAFKNTSNPSLNQVIQIGVNSEVGNYILMVQDGGISLYDVNTSTTVHHVNWTS